MRSVRHVLVTVLAAVSIVACADSARVLSPEGPRAARLQTPCDEYPEAPECQMEDYAAVVDMPCDSLYICFPFQITSNPTYSYMQNELDRLSRSTNVECKALSTTGASWWSSGWVYGFNEKVSVWDSFSRSYGFLAGDTHHPGQQGWGGGYEMHIHIGNRTRTQILSTYRHELAHAVGYGEADARRLAVACG